MTIRLKRFVSDESGATAIEYGLITVLVALGIIVSLTTLEDSLVSVFNLASASLIN